MHGFLLVAICIEDPPTLSTGSCVISSIGGGIMSEGEDIYILHCEKKIHMCKTIHSFLFLLFFMFLYFLFIYAQLFSFRTP